MSLSTGVNVWSDRKAGRRNSLNRATSEWTNGPGLAFRIFFLTFPPPKHRTASAQPTLRFANGLAKRASSKSYSSWFWFVYTFGYAFCLLTTRTGIAVFFLYHGFKLHFITQSVLRVEAILRELFDFSVSRKMALKCWPNLKLHTKH